MAQSLSLKKDQIMARLRKMGISNLYFEPPASIRLQYPCVVFKRGVMSNRHAGNRTYKVDDAWELTYIRLDPDDDKVHDFYEAFQMIRHARTYVADGLHHDQFKLYY